MFVFLYEAYGKKKKKKSGEREKLDDVIRNFTSYIFHCSNRLIIIANSLKTEISWSVLKLNKP